MANEDGNVLIGTKIDTDGIEKGTKEIKKELSDLEEDIDDVGEKSEKTGDTIGEKLAGGFKKLGAAIAAAQIVEKLVEIGKEAIDLGSDLEEVQNVVDVTFTTMSKKVDAFAKSAKKSAGLSETMAKQYVGTFGAMADSFGFAEAEAYEMATALTQLTGDVASFYNLSQDEAYTKLKSVFTGETESLKDLGVVMTQTALDAYALANGFDKTTSSMTEQEKVALRYQFVMDQLSAASGDFVRTQDSWANQTKLLSLQWESLLATLGSGLISALSPGLEFLNNKVLPAINEFAEDFAEAMSPTPAEELQKSIKTFEKTIKSTNETLEETEETIAFNATRAENYIKKLDELEAAGLDTAESQREYANVVAGLNELYPELNLQIDEQTGLLNANSRAQLENVEAIQQKYFLAALEEQYNTVLTERGNLEAQLYIAEAQLVTLENERKAVTDSLTNSLGIAEEELIAYYWAIQNSGGAMTDANGEVITLTESQQEWYASLLNLNTEIDATNTAITDAKAAMEAQEGEVNDLNEAYTSAAEKAGVLGTAQDKVTESLEETQTALEELETEYATAQEAARDSIDSQVGLFDKLVVESDMSAKEIVANWEAQRVALDQYKSNLQKAIEMGLDEALVKQLSDGSTQSMAILDEFVNNTDLDIDDINEAFRKTEESKETVADAMADVQTEMGKKLAAIETDIQDSWDENNETVRAAIQEMQQTINSLKGKTVYNQVITTYSSTGSSGASTSSTSTYAASSASIPMLAKGTVIPPNAPFMAILGDQRRGTNIEAPLETIQEAVAMVMGDQISAMVSGFESLLEESRLLRQIVETIDIGDTVIGEAANRYRREQAIITGGRA